MTKGEKDIKMWKKVMKKDIGERFSISPIGNSIDIPCIEKIKSINLKQGLFGLKIKLEYYNKELKNVRTKK